MATSEPYRLCWPTGAEQMLIVSVGTGASANAKADLSPDEMHLLYNARTIPSALMAAALYEQDFLCRIFGNCVAGDLLDREVGTVIGQAFLARRNCSPTPATTRNFPPRASPSWDCPESIPLCAADGFRRAHRRNAAGGTGRGGAESEGFAPVRFPSLRQTTTRPMRQYYE